MLTVCLLAWSAVVVGSQGLDAESDGRAYAKSVVQRNGVSDYECSNGPSSRHCWDKQFDINTDVEKDWPKTGDTVQVSYLGLLLEMFGPTSADHI